MTAPHKNLYIAWMTILVTSGLISCGVNDTGTEYIKDRLFALSSANEALSPKAVLTQLASDNPISSQLEELLYQSIGDSRIKPVAGPKRSFKSSSGNQIQTESFSLSYEGVPLCSGQINVHTFSNSVVAMSHLPSVDLNVASNRAVDDVTLGDQIKNYLDKESISSESLTINDERTCYFSENNGALWLSKEVKFDAGGLSYTAIVFADQVREVLPNFFDAEGSARVYDSNPATGKLTNFTLKGLVEGGTLENDYFTTSTTGTKASESNHTYNYSPSDGRFDEASLFAHANAQLSFFQELGYEWAGKDKLNLYVHAVVQGSVNNALFTPASGTNPPKIQVGDGDGIRLQNLAKDSDVVSHELGHHIVYNTLKSVKGESLVLHEGLADFFAFARTGDACLGESICPANSPIGCEVEEKCLRTAENDYVLGKNTKPEAHFKSQFVSGFLWDLHAFLDEKKLDQMAYNSVQLMLAESGYHDLVLALLLSDKEENSSKNCQDIYDNAVSRGLQSHIADIGCGDALPELSALDNAGGETSLSGSSSKKSKKDSSLFGCGVVGTANTSTSGLAFIALAGLLPLLMRKRRR